MYNSISKNKGKDNRWKDINGIDIMYTDIRTIKNPADNSVLIYHAYSGQSSFNLSVERFIDKQLVECAEYKGLHITAEQIKNLMLEICTECLEPCHLKDIINDMDLNAV